jgi:poly(3-hydroxybutyrate) depolymerase
MLSFDKGTNKSVKPITMKRIYKRVSFIIFLSACILAQAQQTGHFDKTISFSSPSKPNQTRTLSYNVPANYSSAKKYKLFVGLHGQGSSPQNFCGMPVDNGFLGDVILVCPSEGGSMSGFCDATGEDDGILDAAVANAESLYNIDHNYVIITGFSFGGRCGLRYGLNDYSKYRGMMLFAPAVNSIAHAQNNHSALHGYRCQRFLCAH